MRSSKHFSVVYLLVTLVVVTVINANAASNGAPLLNADAITAEWVDSEAVVFNKGQKQLTNDLPYSQVSPETLDLAASRLCQFRATMLSKIAQINLQQNNRYAQCGFKSAKAILESIPCQKAEKVSASELVARHNLLLRAAAAIHVGGFDSDGKSCE
jgi:hypothetical protein